VEVGCWFWRGGDGLGIEAVVSVWRLDVEEMWRTVPIYS